MDKIRLLYVEDEPFLARIVQESLESREFEVLLINDGSGAVAAFERFKPDICVLDVMLPNKDGFTIAREIKKKNPGMPIVFLTAKTQTEDLLQGFESGGNDYLRKPFSMEELIVRIHNLLRIVSGQPQHGPADKIPEKAILGKYIYFPLRYELHLEGLVKKLSQRENQLLQMLIKEPGSTVMRRDILLSLWGDDSYYNSRSLDVYVSRLRDYFSGDNGVQITTIKGVGYLMKWN